MCWNGQASATLATLGLASTAYVAYRGEEKSLWMPLAYFSLMELLQAITYTVIDQCGLPMNQVLTALGSLHIAFQPFFLNAFAMHFIPKSVSHRIAPFVYGVCVFGSIILLLMVYPFPWAGSCHVGRDPFCGEHLCSVSGNWHIAWEAPLNGLTWAYLGYFLPVFLMPVLYGSWKFILYHVVVGPGLAWLLTDNMNEWPAVWCLLSIGMLLVVVKTPLRQLLYTDTWIFWQSSPLEADTDAPTTDAVAEREPTPSLAASLPNSTPPKSTM